MSLTPKGPNCPPKDPTVPDPKRPQLSPTPKSTQTPPDPIRTPKAPPPHISPLADVFPLLRPVIIGARGLRADPFRCGVRSGNGGGQRGTLRHRELIDPKNPPSRDPNVGRPIDVKHGGGPRTRDVVIVHVVPAVKAGLGGGAMWGCGVRYGVGRGHFGPDPMGEEPNPINSAPNPVGYIQIPLILPQIPWVIPKSH